MFKSQKSRHIFIMVIVLLILWIWYSFIFKNLLLGGAMLLTVIAVTTIIFFVAYKMVIWIEKGEKTNVDTKKKK